MNRPSATRARQLHRRPMPVAPMRRNLQQIILQRIVRGDLPPGAWIKESLLAEQFKVSRTPVREALLRLESDGFVRSELARGFFVEPLSSREVRECYPIMWTLEGLALSSSFPIVGSAVAELTKLNTRFASATKPEIALDFDSCWHETLTKASPNRRLDKLIARLRSNLRRYEHFYMRDMALIAESVKHHARVIECISERDLPGALDALTQNWRFGMETLLLRIGEP